MAKSNVHLDITGDQANLVRALTRSEQEVDKLKEKLRDAGGAAGKAGADADRAFKVWSRAAVVAGAAITAAFVKAFRDAETEGNAAAERMYQRAEGLKDLLQISEGGAQYAGRKELLNQLRTKYGFTEQGAQAFQFKMASLGASQQETLELGRIRQIEQDPLGLIESAQKIRQILGPEALGGSLLSVASVLGVGAEPSPFTGAGLGQNVISPLASGKQLGFDPEDVIAAVSQVSLVAPTPEEGRTQVLAFFKSLMDERNKGKFTGIGFFDAMEKFQGLSPKKQREVLGGRQEALFGASLIIPKLDDIRETSEAIRREAGRGGTEESFVRQKERLAREDPELVATMRREQAKARREVSERQAGILEAEQDAMVDIVASQMRDQGANAITRAMSATVQGVLDVVGATPETMARAGALFAPGRQESQYGAILEAAGRGTTAQWEQAKEAFRAGSMEGTRQGMRESNRDGQSIVIREHSRP